MGQVYSRSEISDLEGLMTKHVAHWIGCISLQSSAVDLISACRALEADIVCKILTLGQLYLSRI